LINIKQVDLFKSKSKLLAEGIKKMKRFNIKLIFVCIFLFSANITQGQDNSKLYFFYNHNIKKDTKFNAEHKYDFGFKIGLTRIGIRGTNNLFKVEKISDNYKPFLGAFFLICLKPRWQFGYAIAYKQLGFKGSGIKHIPNFKFDIDINYLSSQFILNYFLSFKDPKPSLFAGIDFSTLLSSEEKYIIKYSLYQINEHLKSESMKNILKKASASFILGASSEFFILTNIYLSLETELNIISLTKERVYKEGDYNPLPYPFKFVNLSLKLMIPIYRIK
jgi:hypothetical protein